jgi:predicted permease
MTAGPEFFRAAGIPVMKGREFTITDRRGSESVVIINETLAATLFAGGDPIGRRIAWTGDVLRFTPISDEWRTVVGVAGDTRNNGLDTPPQAAVYMPFEQMLALGGSLVIRTEGNAAALVPDATRIIRRIAPAAPIERVLTIAQIKDQSVSPRRLNAALLSAFGLLALIIAAVGIGGVLGFSVSARTHEIGIRMGLGADRWRVQGMILREGGVLLAAGLIAGIALAILTARVIQGLLFGVEPHDPATFAGVAILMALIGLLACWIPALRASRVDPTITMRSM